MIGDHGGLFAFGLRDDHWPLSLEKLFSLVIYDGTARQLYGGSEKMGIGRETGKQSIRTLINGTCLKDDVNNVQGPTNLWVLNVHNTFSQVTMLVDDHG